MKSFFRRALTPTAVFLATAALAQAHPGHGDHDFTWDFTHLAANPGATILCFGLLAAVAWGVLKLTRPSTPSLQPIRVRTDDSRRGR
ncbi:MAG: hypothetical protein NTV51_26810 [Verrucomicrobia bacterium]|nr:hypothetical protein [Verrucomicrobiota bacterium]